MVTGRKTAGSEKCQPVPVGLSAYIRKLGPDWTAEENNFGWLLFRIREYQRSGSSSLNTNRLTRSDVFPQLAVAYSESPRSIAPDFRKWPVR
jgi:hypothetical protein